LVAFVLLRFFTQKLGLLVWQAESHPDVGDLDPRSVSQTFCFPTFQVLVVQEGAIPSYNFYLKALLVEIPLNLDVSS
jgi:hypothetical protein